MRRLHKKALQSESNILLNSITWLIGSGADWSKCE